MRNKSNIHRSDATAGKKHIADNFSAEDGLAFYELPPPPENLLEGGHFWWQYYGGILIEARCFSRLYLHSMTCYCNLCSIIEDVETELKEQGVFTNVIKTVSPSMAKQTGAVSGEEYIDKVYNPLIPSLQRLYDQHDRLANSMGFTIYSSKAMSIDTTGNQAAETAPQPPEVLFSPETIPFLKESAS